VPGWNNVFVAAGHYRAGIQLSIGTGLLMKDLLLGRQPEIDPTPFQLAGGRAQKC
jgi:glycine oxidase